MYEKERILLERYELALERIRTVSCEETVPSPYLAYFRKTAEFILLMESVKQKLQSGETTQYSMEQWEELAD